ncbi:hypothetical protein [Paractinoplanes brasiliensis]|uniref:Uncharacterized protein n=1 Tax=Paractinoplanes brasiliensis TaxID=52695 RepID=A0A4R6JBI0_9ACTN|nr:hypothetical protein [Actinoplanes brasiliensis]TDO33084.1 hypothetical protein C8E87_8567 [Actinoplanes brasiliensis]
MTRCSVVGGRDVGATRVAVSGVAGNLVAGAGSPGAAWVEVGAA